MMDTLLLIGFPDAIPSYHFYVCFVEKRYTNKIIIKQYYYFHYYYKRHCKGDTEKSSLETSEPESQKQ